MFIESWTMCWTLVLALGYIGRKIYWPGLAVLCGDIAVHAMLLASGTVVAGLCLYGFAPAGLSLSGWAIGMVLIRRTVFAAD
jgi:hypothetical protein